MLGLDGSGGGINPATFQASPGYQYALQQGTQAVNNAAATGGGVGGNALKQLQSTGQGLANQNFSNYLNTSNTAFQGLLGSLGGLVNTGQGATDSITKLGANDAAQLGAYAIGGGNAQGSGIMGSANALAGGIKGALSSLGSGFSGFGGGGVGGGGMNALLYSLMNQGGAPIPGQPSLYGGQMVDTTGWNQSAGPNNIPASVWGN